MVSTFSAHQAAELYLKGFLVIKTGTHPFTHDLGELIDVIQQLGYDIPKDVVYAAEFLTPHYVLSRYPREKPIRYTKRKSEMCIEAAEKIVN